MTRRLSYMMMNFDRLKKTNSPLLIYASLVFIDIDENSIRNELKIHWLQHLQDLNMTLRQHTNPLSILNGFSARHGVQS